MINFKNSSEKHQQEFILKIFEFLTQSNLQFVEIFIKMLRGKKSLIFKILIGVLKALRANSSQIEDWDWISYYLIEINREFYKYLKICNQKYFKQLESHFHCFPFLDQLGHWCWVRHLLQRWWYCTRACWVIHRFWWLTKYVLEQFWSFCYL